ncbi:MAG: HAD family hydrolase [Lachnospiraceae bacterium]|nr:HAD family hydrolase [Lachnospiraceae bacterium]
MIRNILFDLDGTLLPMDMDEFTTGYFKLLVAKVAELGIAGFDGKVFINHIWGGTKRMVLNDGSRPNMDAFWEYIREIFGDDTPRLRRQCESFYANEFDGGKQFCGYNGKVPQLVEDIKRSGYRVVLATNPIFPDVATVKRTTWAGLSVNDFEGYTTYENSTFCKPNPKYFTEVAQRFGLVPEECLMVGNDAEEDLAAVKTGMKVFLITDYLVNKKGMDISDIPHGSFDDLRKFLEL